jgi:uncharacterized protein
VADPDDQQSNDRMVDRTGLEILPHDECLALLASSPVARIAFVDEHGEPMILPINIAVWEGAVAFSTGEGSKLDAATRAPSVAIEVDGWEARDRSGWSVVGTGPAREVHQGREIAALDRLGVRSWVSPDVPKHWILVRMRRVSGRRTPSGDERT